jgi:hypothetical protein
MNPAALLVLLKAPKGSRRKAVAEAMLMSRLAPVDAESSMLSSAISADFSAQRRIDREERIRREAQAEISDAVRQLLSQLLTDGSEVDLQEPRALADHPALRASLEKFVDGCRSDARKLVDDAGAEGERAGEIQSAEALVKVSARHVQDKKAPPGEPLSVGMIPDLMASIEALVSRVKDPSQETRKKTPELLGELCYGLIKKRFSDKRLETLSKLLSEHGWFDRISLPEPDSEK